ncbi:MAG TPA: HAMP domain-containing sensor histidine kinase [Longimicrobium sp.]|jgi:signal transduction histidine kinase|nr:HAMP domain-containing sensor histidine kinase [Longimicrobium sp.]
MILQVAAGPADVDMKMVFAVMTVVVISVVVFTGAVIVALLRRSDRRRVEEEKLAAIGTATARILHQIKNPLQTIVLHADMLQDERIVSGAHQRREVCEAIVGESQRLVAMTDELSVYASGARRTLSRRPMRLDDLVRQVTQVEAREAAETGLVLDASAIVPVTVNGDAYYLRQVFENLVRNAREAMEGREEPPRLWVSVARAGTQAEVRVTDNGPGIPPEILQSIFDPFFSTKGKGMGLGLSICREIVQGHGGRLDVESTLGRGTTFTVTLPVHTEAPALAPVAA